MQIIKIIACICFFLGGISTKCNANANHLSSYVGLSYNNLIKNGYTSAFAFHDHDPKFGNNNFHIHNNCNPFKTGKEVFQAIVLTGQYAINKKIALTVNLPYSIKTQQFENEVGLQRKGLGDVELGFTYNLLETKPQLLLSKAKHSTFLSLFAKLKTGKFNAATGLNDIDPHIQNGTGSTNWEAILRHFVDFKKWNLDAMFAYELNTKNYYQFKRGNALEVSILGAYTFNIKEGTWLKPGIRFSYQNKTADTMEDRMILKPTSFKAILTNASIIFAYKHSTINFSYGKTVQLKYDEIDVLCRAPERHDNFNLELKFYLPGKSK